MMKKFLREPLLHFLLIGVGLFLLFGWRGGAASPQGGQSGSQPTTIIVTQSDMDQMIGTFTRTWLRTPTEEEVNGLVESFIRDEIYFQEAVGAGLDRDDSVIRRRMRLKMEYILEDIAAQGEPTDADLEAFLQKHPERYHVDPRISFRHVYINSDKRGKDGEAYGREVLSRLNEGAHPDTVGDPFLLGSEVRLLPLWDVKNRLGEDFSKSLLELKPGKWEGPVRSGFGLHLVFVMERTGERLPALNEVRDKVKQDWAAERQKELKDAAYARLRERYTVVVEPPAKPGKTVTPEKAGVQKGSKDLDSGFRRNDAKGLFCNRLGG